VTIRRSIRQWSYLEHKEIIMSGDGTTAARRPLIGNFRPTRECLPKSARSRSTSLGAKLDRIRKKARLFVGVFVRRAECCRCAVSRSPRGATCLYGRAGYQEIADSSMGCRVRPVGDARAHRRRRAVSTNCSERRTFDSVRVCHYFSAFFTISRAALALSRPSSPRRGACHCAKYKSQSGSVTCPSSSGRMVRMVESQIAVEDLSAVRAGCVFQVLRE